VRERHDIGESAGFTAFQKRLHKQRERNLRVTAEDVVHEPPLKQLVRDVACSDSPHNDGNTWVQTPHMAHQQVEGWRANPPMKIHNHNAGTAHLFIAHLHGIPPDARRLDAVHTRYGPDWYDEVIEVPCWVDIQDIVFRQASLLLSTSKGATPWGGV